MTPPDPPGGREGTQPAAPTVRPQGPPGSLALVRRTAPPDEGPRSSAAQIAGDGSHARRRRSRGTSICRSCRGAEGGGGEPVYPRSTPAPLVPGVLLFPHDLMKPPTIAHASRPTTKAVPAFGF